MNYLLLALKYFPLILQAVVVVEQIASNKEGKDKKALVVDSINAAAQLVGSVDNEQVKVIGVLVDSTVSSLNKTGVFQQSNKSPKSVLGRGYFNSSAKITKEIE